MVAKKQAHFCKLSLGVIEIDLYFMYYLFQSRIKSTYVLQPYIAYVRKKQIVDM